MNVFKFDDTEEFIHKLLEFHHPEVVRHFMMVYMGVTGIGLLRIKVDGQETSAICGQAGDEGDIHVLFVAPHQTMKIESVGGEKTHNTMTDSDGNPVTSH